MNAASNELLQCRGKENKPPVARYIPQVQSVIASQHLVLKDSPRMTGLVQDAEGRVHSIAALPEGLSVGGNLDLSGTAVTVLPEGLSVGGKLNLSGTAITALPEGLIARGMTCQPQKRGEPRP